jgi:hypothetical protein
VLAARHGPRELDQACIRAQRNFLHTKRVYPIRVRSIHWSVASARLSTAQVATAGVSKRAGRSLGPARSNPSPVPRRLVKAPSRDALSPGERAVDASLGRKNVRIPNRSVTPLLQLSC